MIGIMVSAPDVESAIAFVERMDEATQPAGRATEAGLAFLLEAGTRFASEHTHIWTGTLFVSYLNEARQNLGVIYIDPGAKNPYGRRPADYAQYEFARGGSHDAFTLTQEHIEAQLVPEMAGIIVEEVAGA